MPDSVVIAIDGPSASGKSTVSREVARRLGMVYVDSGALYRGFTWKLVREGVEPSERDRVMDLLSLCRWDFYLVDRVVHFRLSGEDPWDQLRSPPVRERVADVAAIPEVRHLIGEHLRSLTRFGDLVMEGRDIGSVVFPETEFKYYLDADPEERARRRFQEVVSQEQGVDLEQIKNSLRQRDQKDSTRPTAPLQIPLGAKVINTTGIPVDRVVEVIVQDAQERLARIQRRGQ